MSLAEETVEWDRPGQGEEEHGGGEDEEHEGQVDDGEPAVGGSGGAQHPGNPHRQPHARHRVEDADPRQVEEHVYERDLVGRFDVVAAGREAGQQGGGRGAQVRAFEQEK